ncbi:glycosyl hydrolase [Pseudothauera rhizosphaerae]|uniref:Glycosyl hydrolase n=1 Tax=Pseudothauera rhizosphaerae TaxID=2565932 RepID=A0A4S4ASW7_9RHOO|nr:glycosyl hydrolase [Pseudothauera rhizosphaerae]
MAEQIASSSPPAPAARPAAPGEDRRRGRAVGGYVVSALPWLIIAGLLWAGLFVKPQPVGASLQPPVLERRDHYYGLAAADGLLLAAGSGGKILRIDPASGRIKRVPTPTGETLQDVATWDGTRAVAVGNDGVILVSADGGATWTQVADVPRSEIANKFARARTAPGGVAVASGEMGALLMSRDFGATWTRLREEEDLAWNDVALIGEAGIVAVGEFGRIVVSGDGGATWNEIPSPAASSLMAVAFRDGQHGVAVGLEGVVLTTQDGGLTWTRAEADVQVHLFDVSWDAAGARWIGAGALGSWITADGEGRRWQSGRLDERDLSWHTRVLPADGQAWFAGANVGRWDGRAWVPLGN